MHPIELRRRVVSASLEGHESPQEVADRFLVSRHFVMEMMSLYHATGDVLPRSFGGGRRKLDPEGDALLCQLVEAQPDATLEELSEQLLAKHGAALTPSGVHRATIRLGLTYKKSRSTPANRSARMSRSRERPSLVEQDAAPQSGMCLSTNSASISP